MEKSSFPVLNPTHSATDSAKNKKVKFADMVNTKVHNPGKKPVVYKMKRRRKMLRRSTCLAKTASRVTAELQQSYSGGSFVGLSKKVIDEFVLTYAFDGLKSYVQKTVQDEIRSLTQPEPEVLAEEESTAEWSENINYTLKGLNTEIRQTIREEIARHLSQAV